MPKIRSRKVSTYKGKMEHWFDYEGKIYPPSYFMTPIEIFETQRTESVGTPFATKRNAKRFKGTDMGSDFFTTKSVIFQPKDVDLAAPGGAVVYRYKGPYFAYSPMANSLMSAPSVSDMNAWGATSISRVLPTNPLSGIGQFVGELRDIPRLPFLASMKKKANSFRELSRRSGSEYLNVQFGWVPFVKELLSLSETMVNHSKHVAQYDRDSGRIVRRRITLINTSVTNTEILGDGHGNPVLPSPHYTHPGQLTRTTTTSTRIWFSGAFTYYFESGIRPSQSSKSKGGRISNFIPAGSDPELVRARNAQIRSKLYGLRLDPYLLYQLYPWSWAADWMTNLGANIRNIVAFNNDGLVMKYGYIMHEKRITTRLSLNNLGFFSGNQSFHDVHTQVTKARQRATPFGFGLNPDTFSARQWSIIGALGLTRGIRS